MARRALRSPLLLSLLAAFAPACAADAPGDVDSAPPAEGREAITIGESTSTEAPRYPSRLSDDERRQKRADHWQKQRAYPAAEIPEGAYASAEAAWSKIPRAFPRGKDPVKPLGPTPPADPTEDPAKATWDFLGPAPLDVSKGVYATPNMSPTGGRTSAIAVDPTNSNIVYVGTAMGGVWKSSDNGKTWKPLMDDQPSLAVGSIAVDPATPSTVYVGTGEPAYRGGYGGRGLYKSTDAGATWSKIGGDGFDALTIGRLILDGADIYLAAAFGAAGRGENCTSTYSGDPGQGAYKSTDGGKTFALLRAGRTVDLEVDTTVTPRRLYLSDYDTGVQRSVDGGKTWTAPTGIPASPYGRAEIATTAADPNVVYVGQGEGSIAHVYRSTDAGQTFTELAGAPNYCYSQCDYDNSVMADPTDASTVWLGGGLCAIYKTTTGLAAQTDWANVSLPNGNCGGSYENWSLGRVHPDVHAIGFDPKNPAVVYAASDGGLARTSDGGATWARLNEGVGTVQLYGLCVDSTDPDIVYGGAQDNGSFVRLSAAAGWKGVLTGDGGPCAVDSGDPNVVLMSGEGGSVIRSKDGFKKLPPQFVFEPDDPNCKVGTDPACQDRTGFIAPIAADPVTKDTFYMGTYRIWQSTLGGTKPSWKAISKDLTGGLNSVPCVSAKGGKGDDVLSTITVAPSSPATIYTGSQGGVISVTADGGATWTNITKAPLPKRWVSGIAVDPLNADTVYAAFSGFDTSTKAAPGHLFVSTDRGGTWTKLDIGVDAPIDALVAHPVAQGLLYAGTDLGVMVSTDSGKTFAVLGDSLPNVAVYSLAFQRGSTSLFAGTFGRSAWRMTFTSGALAASPAMLTFAQERGMPEPTAQVVTVVDQEIYGSITDITVASDSPWLTATTATTTLSGPTGAVVTAAITPNTPVGEYDGKITVTPTKSGVPLEVPIHLSVTAEPIPTPPTKKPDDSGCGCRAAGSPADARLGALALGALGLFLSRRRRGAARR
ncbi:MAG: MYXO-CTERM sorting domain-containing protein [Byssovorax sp.]